MKRFLFLMMVLFSGCSSDDKLISCCDRIDEVITVQTLRDGKIEFESTILTKNECTGELIWKHSIDYKLSDVPQIGQCYVQKK